MLISIAVDVLAELAEQVWHVSHCIILTACFVILHHLTWYFCAPILEHNIPYGGKYHKGL